MNDDRLPPRAGETTLRPVPPIDATASSSEEMRMHEMPRAAPPLLRVVPVCTDPVEADGAGDPPGHLTGWVPQKLAHQSLKAALRRVLAYEVRSGSSSRIDLWLANGLEDAWIAGSEGDLRAVLRHLVEHDRGKGAEVTVRDRAPDEDMGVLVDERRPRRNGPRAAADLAALHEAASRLGVRVRAGAGVHAGSPHGMQLIAQFPPPFSRADCDGRGG